MDQKAAYLRRKSGLLGYGIGDVVKAVRRVAALCRF